MVNAEDAEEVVPGKGYRYYGAAKKLPGVKELFSKAAPERQKRTRHEMMKGIDADYYGAPLPAAAAAPAAGAARRRGLASCSASATPAAHL